MRLFLYSFFFFKQKTAYEMRISDWSSDVCSSDLIAGDHAVGLQPGEPAADLAGAEPHRLGQRRIGAAPGALQGGQQAQIEDVEIWHLHAQIMRHSMVYARKLIKMAKIRSRTHGSCRRPGRSEEHTSELQSLMRISYAVFCLKKKHTRN